MINIKPVDTTLDIDLSHYELPAKQMVYAGHPRFILTRTKPHYTPFIIEESNRLIGVFALETGEILRVMHAPDNAIYLRGLSINYHEQNKGYFKATLSAIERFLSENHPDIQSIYLMVNVNNDAYYAFIKSGFKDEKRLVRKGLSQLKVLSKKLSN
ncbi:GNAT family N-acetyltransferase [Macrococcoides caseolyticum]|uniref:GNAT family N-acetyltransferase n=1 Tax=Macrococcoides caseolyticum TaxID=69966 RepID=UPI001F46C017|nr:GNAT family N-acetyltransferase [Macrococcus caseolyticus]MCE4955911.1 GNAT family N-acetyltransferase [Macrococcus caseolyticus]